MKENELPVWLGTGEHLPAWLKDGEERRGWMLGLERARIRLEREVAESVGIEIDEILLSPWDFQRLREYFEIYLEIPWRETFGGYRVSEGAGLPRGVVSRILRVEGKIDEIRRD